MPRPKTPEDEVIAGNGFRDEIIYTLQGNVAEVVNRDGGAQDLRIARLVLAYKDRFPQGYTFISDGKCLIMVPRGCDDGGEEGREPVCEGEAVSG